MIDHGDSLNSHLKLAGGGGYIQQFKPSKGCNLTGNTDHFSDPMVLTLTALICKSWITFTTMIYFVVSVYERSDLHDLKITLLKFVMLQSGIARVTAFLSLNVGSGSDAVESLILICNDCMLPTWGRG
ncbi:hypothetical protein [Orrella sp. 11846]|uniref:hypothetical protein n=1 Tax=Orrella sp. 11846 TaxID=3409913 RepID=UPI003B5A1667